MRRIASRTIRGASSGGRGTGSCPRSRADPAHWFVGRVLARTEAFECRMPRFGASNLSSWAPEHREQLQAHAARDESGASIAEELADPVEETQIGDRRAIAVSAV